MKITKSQLEQLIREELENTLMEVKDPGPPPFNYAAELKKVGGDKKKLDPAMLKKYRAWYKQKQAFKKSGGAAKPAAGQPAQQKAGGGQKADPNLTGPVKFEGTQAVGDWKQKSIQTSDGWQTVVIYKGKKLLIAKLTPEGKWIGTRAFRSWNLGADAILGLWNYILRIF